MGEGSAQAVKDQMIAHLAQIEVRIEEMESCLAQEAPSQIAADLLSLSEEVLQVWILARGQTPTSDAREGFRLLALHRQGARGDPSFNACRETCRELAYHYNLIHGEPEHPHTLGRLRLMIMVAKHLCLFVSGKMRVASLGQFCCASKPLRENMSFE
ncbi:MAG: hypothetical protein J0H36_02895 [Hyphomicrobium denitrificans]|nr:hypothetical protein [Hyphomicrobium denitrificans]